MLGNRDPSLFHCQKTARTIISSAHLCFALRSLRTISREDQYNHDNTGSNLKYGLFQPINALSRSMLTLCSFSVYDIDWKAIYMHHALVVEAKLR